MENENHVEALRYWVWLSIVLGAGNFQASALLRNFSSPQSAYEMLSAGYIQHLPSAVEQNIRQHSLSEAEKIVDYCQKNHIQLVTIDSPSYPPLLRWIDAPPLVLNIQGNAELLMNSHTIAIVGTRHPSPYSETVIPYLLNSEMRSTIVVASGFAKGIDSISHQFALENCAGTIAVLGCGLNVNYPKENAELRRQMVTSGKGVFISEYMPGVQPYPANFPKRNRILSGIATATIVIEAGTRSGSLITAHHALDQGRQVFCVPPANLMEPRYAGVKPLLRDGAAVITSSEDLDDFLLFSTHHYEFIISADRVSPPRLFKQTAQTSFAENKAAPAPIFSIEPEEEEQMEEKDTESAPYSPEMNEEKDSEIEAEPEKAEEPMPDSEEGRRIVQYLREHGDTHANDLALQLELDLSTVLSTLTLLELDGFVESLFGKQYHAI